MKELRFRAWDGKRMIEDVIPASETSIVELFEYEHQVTDVEAIEQYTGLKDKKIRKAIRVWAEANEISQAQFDRYISGFSASDDGHNILSMISFDGFVFMFVDGKYYTINELCGEEEE